MLKIIENFDDVDKNKKKYILFLTKKGFYKNYRTCCLFLELLEKIILFLEKKKQESHPFPEKTKTFQDYHSQKLFFVQKQRFYLSYFYLIVNINMVLKNLLLKNDT